MDPPTVDTLVQGLGAAFEAGLDSYSRWMERQETRNHYYRRPSGASMAAKCALGASFDISNHRIRATYQVAFAIAGLEFAVGDETCRACLAANLRLLEESVGQLVENLAARARPIDLGDAFRTSESVRIQCVSALAEQYRRFSAGRALPPELPIPKPRVAPPATDPPSQPAACSSPTVTSHQDCDQATMVWSCDTSPLAISELPSPPPTPTPKTLPDQSPESVAGHTGGLRNGVFSIFCSQAMALQVDPGLLPSRFQPPCQCGFRWDFSELAPGVESVSLKHGFRLTRRFLAKSHCGHRSQVNKTPGPGASQHKHGYGCVFCTSTGRTDEYASIEDLRLHIDTIHTKWQMLHDHDMASLSG